MSTIDDDKYQFGVNCLMCKWWEFEVECDDINCPRCGYPLQQLVRTERPFKRESENMRWRDVRR